MSLNYHRVGNGHLNLNLTFCLKFSLIHKTFALCSCNFLKIYQPDVPVSRNLLLLSQGLIDCTCTNEALRHPLSMSQ